MDIISRFLDARKAKAEAEELKRRLVFSEVSFNEMHNAITAAQAMTDITTNEGDATSNTHYTGNPYPSYESKVSALSKKYNGDADWGCQIIKNIVDVRAAFCIGRGVQVVEREGFEGKAERELEFVREFLHQNGLDERKPGDWGKEAEIEGKVLLELVPMGEGPKAWVKVNHIPWRKMPYKVGILPPYFEQYTGAWYEGQITYDTGFASTESKDVAFKLTPDRFVFARFGGNTYDTWNTPPKAAFVLQQAENLDKELWDWRKINHLFAAPTPVFEFDAECADEAAKMDTLLRKNNWRIGKYIVIAGGVFRLETYSGEGFTTIQKAIEADVQAISGSTGVPVHFLGHPNLLSNRSTAENLLELIELSTDKERDTWTAAYTELIQKAILIKNAVSRNNLNPDAVAATIPFSGGQNLKAIETVYLPMYVAGAISLTTLLGKLVGVDPDTEEERVRKEQAERDEREARKARDAAISQGGATGNGGRGNPRNGQ